METSKSSHRKLIGVAGIALALLALAPSASAAVVVVPNASVCQPNATFAPAGFGEGYCVYAAGACQLTVIVTDGTTIYTYSKKLDLGTPVWVVLVNAPVGYVVGASCPPIA